ncbi:hypothetical protein H5410_024339 [Solanum commersonii]|uniref:Uncharacterized protein n=1 Tax=Solanum commersonii TaxID=4109 RepID=A0A9J5ZLQ1_SOLCO|nr:hypothetical protein H5410_024339 [Solanum commersonii]
MRSFLPCHACSKSALDNRSGNPQPPPFGCTQANMDGYLVFNEKLTAANSSKKYDTIDGGIAGVRGIVEVCTLHSMNAIVGKNVRTPILLLSSYFISNGPSIRRKIWLTVSCVPYVTTFKV